MIEITHLKSILHVNLEHNYSVFSHFYDGHEHLGHLFSILSDDDHNWFMTRVWDIPLKDFKIGNKEFKVTGTPLRFVAHMNHIVTASLFIQYVTDGHAWNEIELLDLNAMPELRDKLPPIHNDAHEEHGLKPRWDIIEEREHL